MRNPSTASAAAAAACGGGGATSSTSPTSKTVCWSKEGLKRGPWTAEEDELLANYIRREGEGRWRTLPKRAGLLRCGKSCRLRWMNYLRPSVKRGQIAPDEEDLILRLHRLLGNRWSLIAGRIPGRTDNEIKNYWNTHLSKKLISQGIDPRTHKPLNPSSSSSPQEIHVPATRLNRNPNADHNPNPDPSGLDETGGGGDRIIFQRDTNDQQFVGYENNWQNSDDLIMGLHRSHGNINEEDDVFSSFLNSLINEDTFGSSQLQTDNGINAQVSDDPLVSSTSQAFDYGTIWEAAAFNEVDHVNKHFS